MDPNLIYYRLGIRLRQAVLIHQWNFGDSCTTPIPPLGVTDIKHTLAKLTVAFGLWCEMANVEDVKRTGREILRKVSEEWDTVFDCKEWERRFELMASHDLEQLETLCREVISTQSSHYPQREDWFNLGQEIVRIEDVQNYAKPPGGRKAQTLNPKWSWKNSPKVKSLLRKLEISQNQLLADPTTGTAPVINELPKHWMESFRTYGWPFVEAGLKKLTTASPPMPTKHRPCYDRDHQFLSWYNDKSSKDTYHSPTGIVNRWIQQHPKERVTCDVVKKAIEKARKEARKPK